MVEEFGDMALDGFEGGLFPPRRQTMDADILFVMVHSSRSSTITTSPRQLDSILLGVQPSITKCFDYNLPILWRGIEQ